MGVLGIVGSPSVLLGAEARLLLQLRQALLNIAVVVGSEFLGKWVDTGWGGLLGDFSNLFQYAWVLKCPSYCLTESLVRLGSVVARTAHSEYVNLGTHYGTLDTA